MPPHVYHHHDGTPIPSVSTVLAQLKSSWRGAQLEAGAVLGTLAHALVERILKGEAVAMDDVPEGVAPSIQAFQAWRWDRDPVVERLADGRLASELSMVTPAAVPAAVAYGGTLDFVANFGDRRVVVDVKTRTSSDTGLPTPDRHCLTQTAAYGMLWEMAHPDRPLAGGLLLMLGRNRAEYRECWLTRAQLEGRMREFACLRAALAEHEAAKMELKASRKADKAGRAA